ncbi:hypothetical protein GCM10010504_49990 [Streptomyces griseus]|nr:hypothetical protein GCM10010504_49990 [Streptomyces griseus]
MSGVIAAVPSPDQGLERLAERDVTLWSFAGPLWRVSAEASYRSVRPLFADDSKARDFFGALVFNVL